MRSLITIPWLLALGLISGCGAPISKEEYDAKHGKGAWDYQEEQEDWNAGQYDGARGR